jgi:hypothetical protein
MNRRIETALRSKYNFRRHYYRKEMNELFAQGYYICFTATKQKNVRASEYSGDKEQ